MPSVTSKQAEQMRIAQRATKPSAKEFQDATGASDQDVNSVLYGTIGSNVDTRDWAKIMASSDPLAAAREATRQYYDRGAVTIAYTPEEQEERRQSQVRAAVRNAYNRQAREAVAGLQGYGQEGRTSSAVLDALRQAGFGSVAQGLGSPYINDQSSLRRRAMLVDKVSEFLQGGGGGGIASLRPKLRNQLFETIGRATTDPTTVQFTQRVPGTPIAQSVDDPDDPNSRVRNRLIDAQGNPITGFDLRRMQNFGYNPYTLQPMYTTQQDPQTGQVSYTPAFDVSTLRYEFGDVDPYSQEGLSAYYGGIPLTIAELGPTENALGTQTYDILGEIMGRMGYDYEPYDYEYTVR